MTFHKFAAAAAAAVLVMTVPAQLSSLNAVSSAHAQTSAVSSLPDFSKLVEDNGNAVVSIAVVEKRKKRAESMIPKDQLDFFRHFGFPFPFGDNGGFTPGRRGQGSGFIISPDGYILTNNHVVENADDVTVSLTDKREFKAKVVGTDPKTDIALIKIEGKDFPAVRLGNSDNVKVGEWVAAIGAPFGLDNTVTAGIVSAKSRNLPDEQFVPFIQTDVAVNPGNSGGALVNLNGELIGINSAIYSNTGSYSGFSFAIPTTIVKKVMADIRQYGTVQRAMLGCSVVELDAKVAKEKNITAAKAGCLVMSVNDMSTAKEMGLQEDDLITAINGADVHNFAQLQEQISKFRPGDKITITYYRDNKKFQKTGTLRNSQGSTSITKKGDFSELGCAFMKVSQETKQHLGISNGVQVQGLKSGAIKDAGVKDGFIITEINDQPVNSTDDVEYVYNQVMKSGNDERVMFLKGLYPTGKKYYYAVNLESNE